MKKKIIITLLTILTCFAVESSSAQSESSIKRSELPESVNARLNEKYSEYNVKKIFKVNDEAKGVYYKIEVQKKNTLFALVYSSTGELLKKTKSKIYSFDGTEKPQRQPLKHDGHDHRH